jgi:CHAD domain-containing protein
MGRAIAGVAGAESIYAVPGETSPEPIARSLQGLLPTRRVPIPRRRFFILDTVDDRVRRAGARLSETDEADGLVVGWMPRGGRSLAQQLDAPARFVWDLPPGRLHDELASVIGVRRLFAQAEVESYGALLEVQDDRGKMVARVRIESGRARTPDARVWRQMPTLVTVSPLKGYESSRARLLPLVESRPGVTACHTGFHGVALRAIGVPAWDEQCALPVSLDAGIRAGAGARLVHRPLLEALLANEEGVKARLDTEFLHDFRVAVRRTRSLLGQIKDVFPAAAVERFSADFSWLGHLTGPPRDLDVMLLTLRDDWRATNNEGQIAVLAVMEDTRARAHEALVDALEGDRYQRLIDDWQTLLDASTESAVEPVNSRLAFRDIVSSRAWRLCRRVARRIDAVTARTPADELHAIRIEAKKLRYLIDATPAFFDKGDLDVVVGSLKKLQAALGAFNDADIQDARFADCQRQLGEGDGSTAGLAVIEDLMARNRSRKRDLRQAVFERFARFREKPVRLACRRAFAGSRESTR